jgi:hypothetical protein
MAKLEHDPKVSKGTFRRPEVPTTSKKCPPADLSKPKAPTVPNKEYKR